MVRRQGQKAAGFGESAAQRCGTIDSHTARPEGSAGALNQAVKRNKGRFPIDFMFRLSWDETRLVSALRSQNVILKRGGHLKFRPNAFTEHGAVMLAAIFEQPSCRGSIHSSGASICAAAAGSLIARRISSEVGGD